MGVVYADLLPWCSECRTGDRMYNVRRNGSCMRHMLLPHFEFGTPRKLQTPHQELGCLGRTGLGTRTLDVGKGEVMSASRSVDSEPKIPCRHRGSRKSPCARTDYVTCVIQDSMSPACVTCTVSNFNRSPCSLASLWTLACDAVGNL